MLMGRSRGDCHGLSPLVPSPTGSISWKDWADAWGREMALRRALEKLNLEYPTDSG
jgi:hypothetical protein